MKILNLANRPFENRRPIRRISGVLWLAGGLFTALNLWLFWDHLTGFATTTGQLSEVRDQIAFETEEIGRLGQAVAALSLEEQNQEVETLNTLITDRAFPWSLLFDRLENVLPDQVWLAAVQPRRAKADQSASSGRRSSRRTRARRAAREPEGVELALRGQARDSAALRSFVDRLFADPVFRSPNLRNQAISNTGEHEFNLDVLFLVGAAQALMESSGEGQQQVADHDGEALAGAEGELVAQEDPEDNVVGSGGEGLAANQVQPDTVVAPGAVPPPEDLRTMVGSSVVPPPTGGVPRARVRQPSQQNARELREEQVRASEERSRRDRERGTLRTRESGRDTPADERTAGTQRTPNSGARGVPIIPAATIAPTATPVAQSPGAPQAGPAGTQSPATPGAGTQPSATRPSTRPPTTQPTRPSNTPPSSEPARPDPTPESIGPEDLEPVPPSAPASSSARIGGGRR